MFLKGLLQGHILKKVKYTFICINKKFDFSKDLQLFILNVK